MKEIGEKLKETREEMGISLEEAAEDLKLRPTQIENIEDGKIEAFKDIFYLKYFIRDYSKYLGLDPEAMVDEFNEYLFDYTSKISLDDIKEAQNKDKKKIKIKKIASPYTLEKKEPMTISPIIIYVAIAILIAVIIYFFMSINKHDEFENNNTIIGMEENYEFSN